MPVGLVTLISVTKPPMTSSPTNSMPRSRITGPDARTEPAIAVGERAALRPGPGREVAAMIARRGHADERMRHGLAVDEQDPRIPGFGDFR